MKFLKLLFVVILLQILILAGCSSNNNEPAEPAEETKSQQEEVNAEEVIAKGKNVKGMYFEYEIAVPGAETSNVMCWVKGENIRTEMTGLEEQGKVVTIIKGAEGVAYTYMPQENIATRMDFSQATEETSSPDKTLEELNPGDMEYIGKETVDNKRCLVYEMSMPEGTSKTWIWEEYGLPVRHETVINNEKYVVEYKNLKVEDIPDSTFELPPDVQIMDFNMPAVN